MTAREVKRYRTIVADPPWEYSDGYVSMVGPARGMTVRAVKPLAYDQMAVSEIAALPVLGVAHRDAALFLWTTNRYLPVAFGVMEAWGFTYRQTVVWAKSQASPFVASIAPNHAEFLLVGRRGDHRWKGSMRSNIVTVEVAPQHQTHSRKPDVFMDEIERCSEGPYLEMFSRRTRFGWETWGNEALQHVDMGGVS